MDTATVILRTSLDCSVMRVASRIARAHEYFDYTIERCGKINAVNSGWESWTGIGVVTGCAAVMLITQGPLVKNMDARWGITLR
jgi:hypothetical protein